jgi:hypothetical protein
MLPFTTTTVTVERRATGSVKYEDPAYDLIGEAPAVVSNLTGVGRYVAGSGQTVTARLHVNLEVDVQLGDRVTDQSSGLAYEVLDEVPRYEFGINYRACGLIRWDGRSR